MNTHSNALKIGLEHALKGLAETHISARQPALTLLSKLQSQAISADDATAEIKRINTILLKQKDEDTQELQTALESTNQIARSLKKNPNITNSQKEKLDLLSTEGLSSAELIRGLTKACNDFASESLRLRGEAKSITENYHQGQNIILGDINWSSKQMIKSLSPLLIRLRMEHSDDAKVNDIANKVEAESKKQQVNFFDAVNLIEEGLKNLTRVHGKKNKSETEYLKTFQSHLKGMHDFLNKTITENSSFNSASEKEREALYKMLNGFKDSSEKEDDPDKLKKLINDNVNHMNTSIRKILSKQDNHIKQQHRALDNYRTEIRTQKNAVTKLVKDKEELELAIKEIENISLSDKLTGIGNRRAYDEYLDQLTKSGKTYSLIVIDIDHFKSINDNYGHKFGDAVLNRFALYCKTFISQLSKENEMTIFRYGGEEFVIVCLNTPFKETILFSEKARNRLENATFKYEEKSLKVTASIGLAQNSDGQTPQATFEQADKAMYHSKTNGRNLVSFHHNGKPNKLKKKNTAT